MSSLLNNDNDSLELAELTSHLRALNSCDQMQVALDSVAEARESVVPMTEDIFLDELREPN